MEYGVYPIGYYDSIDAFLSSLSEDDIRLLCNGITRSGSLIDLQNNQFDTVEIKEILSEFISYNHSLLDNCNAFVKPVAVDYSQTDMPQYKDDTDVVIASNKQLDDVHLANSFIIAVRDDNSKWAICFLCSHPNMAMREVFLALPCAASLYLEHPATLLSMSLSADATVWPFKLNKPNILFLNKLSGELQFSIQTSVADTVLMWLRRLYELDPYRLSEIDSFGSGALHDVYYRREL